MNKISGRFVKLEQARSDEGMADYNASPLSQIRAAGPGRPNLPPKPQKPPRGNSPRQNRFDKLSSLIGRDAAIKLVEQFGGRRIQVPTKMPPRHSITLAIGAEKATLLARAHGGTWLVVPVGPATFQKKKQEKALLLLEDGMIAKDVARMTGLSDRTVQRLKAKMKKVG